MTPTPSTSGASDADEHPEVAELSALNEGLLSPERSTAVRGHVADCALCADVRTSLDEIRDALGTLPGPARMPDDVAGRIDAALAAEALLDAASVSRETGADPEAPATDTPPVEAATAEAATAPASVSRETGDKKPPPPGRPTTQRDSGTRPPGHAPGPSGPSSPSGPSHSPRNRRRARRRLGILVGAGAAAVLGIGGLVVQAVSTTSSGPATTAESPHSAPPHTTDGTEGTGDTALRQRVQSLVADEAPETTGASPKVDTKQSPRNTPLRGGAATAPSCVRDATGRSGTPVAVDDKVRFGGETGYLLVYPHKGGDESRVDAYIVDPACVSGGSSSPEDVLLQRTYPRQ